MCVWRTLTEELLQVHVHHGTATGLHVRLSGKYRLVRSAARPEAVAMLAKGGIKNGLQHLQQCLLDQAIRHCRNTQLALATVRLRDHDPSYRARPVRSRKPLLPYARPGANKVMGSLGNIQTIHSCCAFVGSHPS